MVSPFGILRSKALNVHSKALNVHSKALNVHSKALNGMLPVMGRFYIKHLSNNICGGKATLGLDERIVFKQLPKSMLSSLHLGENQSVFAQMYGFCLAFGRKSLVNSDFFCIFAYKIKCIWKD